MMQEADTPPAAGDPGELLTTASRGVLAVRTDDGPSAAPVWFWFDGERLWAVANTARLGVAPSRRGPDCAVYVPPEAGQRGLLVRGRGRVFGWSEPLGTLLHAPTIWAALGALAARRLDRVAGYAQDAARIPPEWLLEERVVLRVALDACETVAHPRPDSGLTPRLPPAVPAEVRRRVAGRRDVVVAVEGDDQVTATPAVWGPAFALTTAGGDTVAAGRRMAVLVEALSDGRPSRAAGLTLLGRSDDSGRLSPEEAVWWHGFDWGRVDAREPSEGGVELPD